MLPAPPTPRPQGDLSGTRGFSWLMPRLGGIGRAVGALGLALALLLPLSLAGCMGAAQPPRATLLSALTLQIELTQASIAEALGLEANGTPEVSRVRIEAQETLRIGETPALRLVGHFDWRLAGDAIRVDSPFELVLQPGERGQSWRLARATTAGDGSGPVWITYPLPIKG